MTYRLSACEGKQRLTADRAREVASRSQHDVTAYRCGVCKGWHVGRKTVRPEPYRRHNISWRALVADAECG